MDIFGCSPTRNMVLIEFKRMQVYLNVKDYFLICDLG